MLAPLLDLRTLSVVLMLVTTVLSFFMIFIWRTHKTYAGFGWWAIANLAGAAGFCLLALRGFAPDWLTIVVGNAFASGGVAISLEGARRFLGRASSWRFICAVVGLQMPLVVYFTLVENNLVARIALVSAASAVVGLRCAYEFLRDSPRETKTIYVFTGATYLGFALLMIFRSVAVLFVASNGDKSAPESLQSVSFLMMLCFVIVLTFDYVILNGERLQQELRAAQVELEKLATTDFLTGISNKRSFFEFAAAEILRARRFNHPLTLLMFDIDFFKRVNDTFGHAAGDKVLTEVADVCRKLLRGTDAIGRLGGEEFAALLPHTHLADAKTVAEFLREAIEDTQIEFAAEKIRVTASFGVSELNGADEQIETILERADAALYQAKRAGRNRTVAGFINANSEESAIV